MYSQLSLIFWTVNINTSSLITAYSCVLARSVYTQHDKLSFQMCYIMHLSTGLKGSISLQKVMLKGLTNILQGLTQYEGKALKFRQHQFHNVWPKINRLHGYNIILVHDIIVPCISLLYIYTPSGSYTYVIIDQSIVLLIGSSHHRYCELAALLSLSDALI